MKKLIILLLIFVPLACSGQPQLTKTQAKYYNNLKITDYNMKTDKWVNGILDGKINKFNTFHRENLVAYELFYEDARFFVVHNAYVPYLQEENWEYSCYKKSGIFISLEGVYRTECIRPETFLRIQSIIKGYILK